MDDQLSLEFQSMPSGARLRDDGIQRAVAHADTVNSEWSARAYDVFELYAKANREFMTEDVRLFASARGLPDPPDRRAWGGVARRAARAGIVTRAGYANAKAPNVHCSVNSLWRSNVLMT